MTRVLVALSGHGFGHAAQTAPLVTALRSLLPGLHVTMRTSAPAALLREFFPQAADISVPDDETPLDFGAVMRSPFEVDGPATAAGYVERHRHYEAAVEAERRALRQASPDLLIANISYVTLAAAQSLGIPAVAFSSLNWLEIYRHYAAANADPVIVDDMLAGYRSVARFIAPAPAMRMPDIAVTSVGPVARVVADRPGLRAYIARQIGLAAGERVLLVSLGGIPGGIDAEHWSAEPGIKVIVAGDVASPGGGIIAASSLNLPHLSLLAGVDLLVTKPGYGSFVEAAVHGVPVLYVPRDDWPEAPALVDWLERHGNAMVLPRADLDRGAFAEKASGLWSRGPMAPVPMTGADEAARLIAGILS